MLEATGVQVAPSYWYIEYPECPDCSRRMMFIGQISNEDFDRNMEGLFYMFLCDDCGSTATHYQQT